MSEDISFMNYMKENWVYYAVFLILVIAYVTTAMKECEGEECEYDDLTANESQCWFWVIDEEGKGFGTTTDYCVQLKHNCLSSYHNLVCKWTNESQTGCRCEMW